MLRVGLLTVLSMARLPTTTNAQELVDDSGRVLNTSLLIDLRQGPPPATISASGLYTNTSAQQLAPGIIPYSVNSQLWSDGAIKTRFLALPAEAQIEFSPNGNWVFPENTVLVKNFYLERTTGDPATRQLVETRFLIQGGPVMGWRGFSYSWNDEVSDADLLPTGAIRQYSIEHADGDSVQQLDYQFPAPEDCQRCHTVGSGEVLGLRTAQLNSHADSTNQLATLSELGVFTRNIGNDFFAMPRWVNPRDRAAPVAARARSYLATNCSHCHRPGGLRRTDIDLRHDTPLLDMGIVDQESTLDDLDGVERRILRPGDAANSVLVLRTLARDERRMPPLATAVIDTYGARLLSRWVEELGQPTSITLAPVMDASPLLSRAFPNPFNGATTIAYTVTGPADVSLVVFDVLGRMIRTLVTGGQVSGRHEVIWDGQDDDNQPVASGVYLYRLVAGSDQQTLRMVHLK